MRSTVTRKWWGLLLTIGVYTVTPFYSHAETMEIKLCNGTNSNVSFSVAGFDAFSDTPIWRSMGWWSIKANDCKKLSLSALNSERLFYYATSDAGEWRGEYAFCIHEREPFDILGDQSCEAQGDGYATKRFTHHFNRLGVHDLMLMPSD